MTNAVATLGLDATGVERGAKQAEAALNRVTAADSKLRNQTSRKRMTDGLDDYARGAGRAKKAADGLWETERKVKGNLAGLVTELSGVNSVGQATAITLNRLSETMRIGFAASIGTAVGMAVNQTITETAASLDTLTDKWQDLLKFDERNAGDSALVSNLAKAVDLAKEANREAESLKNKLIPGASAGFQNIAEGAETSRKNIATAFVAGTQRSSFDTQMLQMGDEQGVGKRQLERKRDEALSFIRSNEGLDPAQKERAMSAIQSEFDSMITQLMQKFAEATVAAVQKADAAVSASNLAQQSPLMDSREISARKIRNQRDAASLRYRSAFVNSANQPYSETAYQEMRAAKADLDTADSDVRMGAFTQALDPSTGRLRSGSSRLGDARNRQRRRDNMLSSARRFSIDKGLVRVRRGSGGQAIGGIDPLTGESVGTTRANEEDLARLRSGSLNNPVGVGDSFGRASSMDNPVSIFGGNGRFARDHKLPSAEAATDGLNDISGRQGGIEKKLEEITRLLKAAFKN